MPKIVLAGPIPFDHIETHLGVITELYGAIIYPVIALANLLPMESTVYPVANVGAEDIGILRRLFSLYPNINLSGVKPTPEGTNRIFLRYISQSERLEKQTNKMKPITFEDIEQYVKADCFIFVPVTDFEIPLRTLKRLKKATKAPIIFDAHGPVSHIDTKANRVNQNWDDIDDWLPNIDILKMNEIEASYAAGTKLHSNDDFIKTAVRWMQKGPKQVVMTLGAQGSIIIYENMSKVYSKTVAPVRVDRVVDTTGCGDSFAAGYAYGLLQYGDPIMATLFGNAVAGQKAGFIGPVGFGSRVQTEIQVIYNYTRILQDLEKGERGIRVG